MIKSLSEVVDHPVVVMLYRSGCSGEFLSYAVSQTIQEFCKTRMNWEDSRVIFQDYFQRTLHCGPVTTELLIPRINYYLNNLDQSGSWYMGMSHQHPEHLSFLSHWGRRWRFIEITTHEAVSKNFQHLARRHKLNDPEIDRHSECHRRFAQHLRLEWKDIFVSDMSGTYERILDFLGGHGDFDQYQSLLTEYVSKNHSLIEQAHAD